MRDGVVSKGYQDGGMRRATVIQVRPVPGTVEACGGQVGATVDA